MILADIPAGASVFVDANTLVYHFQSHPTFGSACTTFLERGELRELIGYTASPIVGEMAHRLMSIEAMQAFGWPAQGIANRLRRHPDEIRKLHHFRQAVETVPLLRIRVLPVRQHSLAVTAGLCQQLGMLTNDAIVVALMQSRALTLLASADADFDRVPGITRYAPT